ncbi:SDR family oxidoreductase [Aquabacterium sp.]|uniref:SDR family oxidoreductase n=1 Tax=Aquabacterium sp. TaxID=1872578 RepID=UPI002D04FCAB|nr:SDR family oxidoreductase [Aquabacterium sp.]HSW05811.1 SDR family oxidoreductase [Aquabacterium sp.]
MTEVSSRPDAPPIQADDAPNGRLLIGKVAVVYGGGGAVGGAVARAFSRHGARLFLVGRTLRKLELVASDIEAGGGRAACAAIDVFDAAAITAHAHAIAAACGGIDIAMNATGFHHVQGKPFAELSVDEFMAPIDAYLRSLFTTAKAVAPCMGRRGSVILSLSTPGSRLVWPGFLGYGVTCAAKEAFTKKLAAELAPQGIRVVCLMPNAIADALAHGSHVREVFAPLAASTGTTVEAMLAAPPEAALLKRLPTLAEVAGAAVFAASDLAGAMTGAVMNLSGGLVVD